MPPDLDAWFDLPLGRALLEAETALLCEALDDVFGWELLQIGVWGPPRGLLRACRVRRHTVVSARAGLDGVDIVCRMPQLPIMNDTLDAVLLPHTLEFETDPQAVIREVDRVLVGEGQLIILGFRPLSLWGVRTTAARGAFPPGFQRLLAERRVRDWLALLGYEVTASRHYLYRVPWGTPVPTPAGASGLLKRGLLHPLPAGAYCLKARKRVYTMTPIRPRFRERPAVIGSLVKPTPRTPS
jgi:SAM-dependent methyltransferase